MKKGPYHFIGIGGISMSGIARLLLQQGYQVSGSDLKDSPRLEKLRKMGAKINIGHKEENLGEAEIVVVSSAIPSHNVEYRKALAQKIPIWQRAQMIAELMAKKEGIAIAGTHGKTTTTSMASLLLEYNDFDPTVLVGGEINDIGGNAKLGQGKYLLTEADESDGSFLFYEPQYALVTNIEYEHHNFYESREVMLDYFKKFIEKLPPEGCFVFNADDKGIQDLLKIFTPSVRTISFGFKTGDLQARDIKLMAFAAEFDVYWQEEKLGTIRMKVPGEHNVYNALATISLGLALQIEFDAVKRALESYKGVQRRFEVIGMEEGVILVDDYAHHPTEILATLQAARACGPERIIAVFQPHRYSRTKYLFEEFSEAFSEADEIIISKIFAADEEPLVGFSGRDLAARIAEKRGQLVHYYDDLNHVAKYLFSTLKTGDLLLTLGAGDVYKVAYEFLSLVANSKKVLDAK